ncbi:probable cell division protein kinase ECU11_1290 [Xenia sp. Carnegie-2017]|uniref:probable cell division protein kinase ECU11_1290 n=1 Tax=Xenia sp. Carnegie-2017 TaxID=2897299 RepID=UPI001F032ED8|nr:probable cell division protein kinase ECU11_1290 [Xenia sp. Carnegie-2017]
MAESTMEKYNIDNFTLADKLKERDLEYIRFLGQGRYGRVIKAKHTLDEQHYAIKYCPILTDTAKSCKREIETLTEKEFWKHNIVKYSGCWEMVINNEKFLFIKMELCSKTLCDFVYENNFGNGAEIVKTTRLYRQVFPQILNGLQTLHAEQLVHRDLHVGNILVVNSNISKISEIEIKITDFGLTRKIYTKEQLEFLSSSIELQELSSGVGNEYFRAPELDSSYYDNKVDLYSAGIVLYFLSCYIEIKGKWKEEIRALKDGKRDPTNLAHKDDETLIEMIFSRLVHNEPHHRPSAKEALNIVNVAWKNVNEPSKEVRFPITVSEKKRKIYVRKEDEEKVERIFLQEDSFANIKEQIEKQLGIPKELQVLNYKNVINGKEETLSISSEEKAHEMFLSADEEMKKIIIEVAKAESLMDVDASNKSCFVIFISVARGLKGGNCFSFFSMSHDYFK